jgi:hypothetical protein
LTNRPDYSIEPAPTSPDEDNKGLQVLVRTGNRYSGASLAGSPLCPENKKEISGNVSD